jgi:hypothetical protein
MARTRKIWDEMKTGTKLDALLSRVEALENAIGQSAVSDHTLVSQVCVVRHLSDSASSKRS